MRHTTPTLTIALLLALAGCNKESEPAPPTPAPAPQQPAETSTSTSEHATLPQIPLVEFDRLNEEPVRQELREHYQRAVANPTDPKAVGEYGMKCFVYDFDMASRDCFIISSTLAPRNPRWTYYLAMAHESLGDYDLAIEAYERMIALTGTYQPAHVRLAMLMLDVDRDRACELFIKADKLRPDEARATWGVAQCARLAGELDRAETLYRKAIRLEPKYADAHFGLAQILVQTGRAEEAKEYFVLQKAGKDASDYRDRLAVQLALSEGGTTRITREATGLLQKGNPAGAITKLEDGLILYPDHAGFRLLLAQTALALNDLERVKSEVAAVQTTLPDNIGARSIRAYVHVDRKSVV